MSDAEFETLEIRSGSVARFMIRGGLGSSAPYRVIYEAYIASPSWRARRDAYFRAHAKACAACGSVEDIQLHHATYERFTVEPDSDLVPLCATCHQWVHHLHRSSRHSLRTATDAVVQASRQVVRAVPVQRPPAGREGTSSDTAFRSLRDQQASASRKESKDERAARVARDRARWKGHPLAQGRHQ